MGGAVGDHFYVKLAKVHGAVHRVDLDNAVSVANRETIRERVEGEPGYFTRVDELFAEGSLKLGRPLLSR